MAHLAIFILVLVAAGITETFSRSVVDYDAVLEAIQELFDRGRDDRDHQSFKCPDNSGLYPDPQNSGNYYECEKGHPTLKHCHRGELFDSKQNVCRDQRNAKHDSRRRKNSDEDSSGDKSNESRERHQSFKCPDRSRYGRYPDPRSCKHFYECNDGNSKHRPCERGLFDRKRRQCSDSRDVECDHGLGKDSGEDSDEDNSNESGEKHQSFKCPSTSGSDRDRNRNHLFVDPKSCENYYECKKGRATLKHCHRGKLFDSKKRECVDERKAKCETDSDEEKNFKCHHTWGSFAHPKDCSKYFQCRNKIPKLVVCEKHFLFDEKIQRCLPRKKVNCGKRFDKEGQTTDAPIIKSSAAIYSTTVSTLIPKIISSVEPFTNSRATATETTFAPTTTLAPTTTAVPTTPVPTTIAETSTPVPTTVAETSTPVPTTVAETSTPVPTTIAETSTPVPTTVAETSTPVPTTIAETSTPVPTTIEETSTPVPTTIAETSTPIPTVTENPVTATKSDTDFPVTKPNTPPPTDCKEDDLDCIIDETGEVSGWFDCPAQYGHFAHGSSKQLFIHCDNWKPFIKKCADKTYFSPEYLVCVWI